MESREAMAREEIVWACQKLAAAGLIAASDGNVSCRLGRGVYLITPSGFPKAEVKPKDLLVIDTAGSVLSGNGKPSSEWRLHSLVYEKRADVGAVVHAHPALLTAMTLAGVPFSSEVFPEVWVAVGPVPTAPYAMPSTDEVPRSLLPFVENHHAVLLSRHGSLTMGRDVRQAYYRLEKMEHAARSLLAACVFGGRMPDSLSAVQLEQLARLFS
ncbi:class II aldolase/adducin family protein [Desulfosoma caldarium]|uniref:L-fuculose-phosphate aldolase n=1 Tax=Desulfosoma caldarium TaxID=610254 RepID=A0A3N1VTM4_9BACT|nr:class II aldolase/adducin family protein [Desulfosoma caldarium]ROR03502.1 L-fuculose-phosphate aldolase [Desulfosoma caldarium]